MYKISFLEGDLFMAHRGSFIFDRVTGLQSIRRLPFLFRVFLSRLLCEFGTANNAMVPNLLRGGDC